MSIVVSNSNEEKCQELLNCKDIRFAGIINKLGNLIAGGFKSETKPFETRENCRMLYMQMTLEISMRKDFDSSLGKVDHIISKREKATMISIPLEDNLLLISASPNASDIEIITDAARIFSKTDEIAYDI